MKEKVQRMCNADGNQRGDEIPGMQTQARFNRSSDRDVRYVSPKAHGLPSKRPPGIGVSRPRRKRWWILLLLVALVVSFVPLANGVFGAQTADLLRAALGPRLTAQIEAWYLGAQDLEQRAQYQLTGKHVAAPWHQPPSHATTRTIPIHVQPIQAMPLTAIQPLMNPALAGEGQWNTSGLPQTSGGLPLIAKTFLRPDPTRPYAIATLLQFDMRFTALHLVAGTNQPGGPLHAYGPGTIPQKVQQSTRLLAAFNGGFKYADGHYGMMVNGTTYVPPQPGAATVAVTKQGQVLLGAWGQTPALSAHNQDLLAWRQNAALLIDQGKINPLTQNGGAWGATILNSTYTWRSGLGITSSGTLLYAAGNSLSAATLAKALQAAGAVTAMQTDINPFWVRAFLYHHTTGGQLQITKLHPGMQGTGKAYLQHTQRDFFYITRRSASACSTPTTTPGASASPSSGQSACGG